MNAQIAVDHIASAPAGLVRPDTDVIVTLRAQRRWHNDRTEARAELLSSLTDGDGVLRLDVRRTVTDRVRARAGADLFFGPSDGIFGQFREVSRFRVGLDVDL